MMRKIGFVKMAGAGNDFVLIDNLNKPSAVKKQAWSKLAARLCERKQAIGADGILLLEKSKKADFKMRIFNPDGSEAEMCGNGLRCAVLYMHERRAARSQGQHKKIKIEAKAGVYEAEVTGKHRVRIKMTEPKDICLNLPIEVSGREMKVSYIDAGVPHTVIFVQDLEKIDIESIGQEVRRHERFKPRGTNVDFVEFMDDKNINMRTYERGVEGETLACGTGAVASAVIANGACTLKSPEGGRRTKNDGINVHTKGGMLKVYFSCIDGKVKDVYLEGEAKKVYKGEVDYV